MEPIRAIGELPFRRREALDLLNLLADRDAPEVDYTGFGYARVDGVTLEERAGGRRRVRGAWVLAVHCAESELDAAGARDDVELEFFVEEVAAGYSVTAPLSAFLTTWVPRLLGAGGAGVVVLALCNPRRVVVRRPPVLGATPLVYAFGEVDSWLDPDGSVRLVADRWRVAT